MTTLARSFAVLLAVLVASPVSAQLLHRYSFSGTGQVATDSIGGAHGAILGGAMLGGSGDVYFDGVDDYVELPGGLLSGLSSATWEAWVNWNGIVSASGAWERVFDFGSSTGGQGAQGVGVTTVTLHVRGGGNGLPGAAMHANGVAVDFFGSAPTPIGIQTHFALVFDGTGPLMRIYIDGQLENTAAVASPLSAINDINNWLCRSQWAGDAQFQGTLTEFRMHGESLTSMDIAASFQAGPDSSGVGTPFCSPAVVNSSGQSAGITANGSLVAANNDLMLVASGLAPNQFGLFLNGSVQAFIPNPGGSQGNLCLSGTLGRYTSAVFNSGAQGQGTLQLDLTNTPTPTGPVSVTAGQTWNFQAWYRDLNPGPTSNFTDAVSVTFL